ncbi:SRPBCC family protein [Saccharopolyspora sp. HNM0983]|uniref:SRPBCC family protein n=1 Tax=Saccharopolyspora montiporae TaxID=2781240 RepID=A0A929B7S7_9PSEU|nr:SRPBCC family protein [Saccharopolyspora sp. HNM0983]MBE9373001.1 SRPBCC family protein [Saccharopolyspora sp. HNM0983]
MAVAYASAVIGAEPDEVWELARDFGGLPGWHPAIATSEIEGGGAPSVGAVRRLTTPDGGVIRERLVALDDAQRSYTYDIIESPFAVRSYRATIHLLPITATGGTFAEWYAHFDADAADEPDLRRNFERGVFATGLAALGTRLAG